MGCHFLLQPLIRTIDLMSQGVTVCHFIMFRNFKTAEHLLLQTTSKESDSFAFSQKKTFLPVFLDFDLTDHQYFKDKCHRFCQLFIFFRKGRLIYLNFFFFNFAKYLEMERNLFSWKPGCFLFHECFQGKWIFFVVKRSVVFSLTLACCSLLDTFPFFLAESKSSVLPRVPGKLGHEIRCTSCQSFTYDRITGNRGA